MSKAQFENVGAERGPESGLIPPEKIRIVELDDKRHPKHGFYLARLSPTDLDNVALEDSMFEIGWETGSLAFLCRDGDAIRSATARRRITCAVRANVRRKAAKKPAIKVPYLITKDAATAEEIENAGRKGVPLMDQARAFVAMKDGGMSATTAAARLVVSLSFANQLEACLGLPLAQQGQVNRLEVAVDTGARLAKGGQTAASEAVASATDASGKVSPKRVKAAARTVVPIRPKVRRGETLESVERHVRASAPATARTVDDSDMTFDDDTRDMIRSLIAHAFADGLAYARGGKIRDDFADAETNATAERRKGAKS